MPERRVAERAAALELAGEKAGDVVARGVLHRARVRLERLDEHAARRVAAAAAGELGEELERPLLGPKVGQTETGVGVDDGRELDACEVVALRDHLRAHEDGTLGAREPLERLAQLLRLRNRVRVEPDPLELGDVLLELALQPLRPRPDARELGLSRRPGTSPRRARGRRSGGSGAIGPHAA